VTVLLHFHCMMVLYLTSLKISLDKLAFLAKPEIRVELDLEHKLLAN